MAKRRRKSSMGVAHARTTALATRPNVVVVRSGGGGSRRRHTSRARTVVVHHARRGGRAASKALPATGLALGGAIVGYLQGAGHLDAIPALGGNKMFGLAAVGYLATRMTSNKYVREAGAAALTVAAFEFGREHGSNSAGGGGGRPAKVHGWDGGGAGPFGGI